MSSPAAAAPSPSDVDEAQDPQLYLQELSLQDCSCTRPLCLPAWRRWATKSKSGKAKPHPQHRGGHASVFVPALAGSAAAAAGSPGSVVVFGGSNRQATLFADTWRTDLASADWVQLSGSSPPMRCGHSLVYDAGRHRVLLYGGQQMTVDDSGEMQLKFMRDVWALDCKAWSWSRLPDGGDSPQRNSHSAVVFAPRGGSAAEAQAPAYMVVFGGSDAEGPSDSVWRYGLAGPSAGRWTRVATGGQSPEARELHAACVIDAGSDTGDQLMVISGGRSIASILNSMHALRMSATGTWEWSLVGQCPARAAHTMMPLNVAASAPILPLLAPAAATASSSAAATAAAAPSPAPSFPASSVPLFLFGGTDGTMYYNDVLSYALHPSSLDPAVQGPPAPCPHCQGPPGWSMLVPPEEAKQAETQAAGQGDATGAAGQPASGDAKTKAKRRKRSNRGGSDVQPPMRFAHVMAAVPCVSPAYAGTGDAVSSSASAPAAASSSASASSSVAVPATFLLFGGLNDEADLDDTYFLSFGPYQ